MLLRHLQLLRSHRRILAFGASCAFLSSPGQTFFIALFVASFGASAGLTAGQLGAIYLGATLGSASLLPSVGHWIDRLDLRLYAGLAVLLLAGACFAASMVSGPVTLLAAFLLLRLSGQGLMMHIDVTSTARYFHSQRGLALSLTAMGFPLAIAVTPPLAVAMIGSFGWRMTYAATGLFILCLALPFLLWLIWSRPDFTRPPAFGGGAAPPRALDGLRTVAATRYFWLSLPILLYMPFTSTALTFHIESVAAAKTWSRELLAMGFSGFALGHAAGLFISGFIVDRLTARLMLPLMNLPLFVGIALLGAFAAPAVLFLFLGLLGIASGLVQTSVGAVWAEVYGVRQLGTIRSFAAMLMVAGTAAGPAVLGAALDFGFRVGTISMALLALGATATASAILALWAPVSREIVGTVETGS